MSPDWRERGHANAKDSGEWETIAENVRQHEREGGVGACVESVCWTNHRDYKEDEQVGQWEGQDTSMDFEMYNRDLWYYGSLEASMSFCMLDICPFWQK